jgi:hypothetical protein
MDGAGKRLYECCLPSWDALGNLVIKIILRESNIKVRDCCLEYLAGHLVNDTSAWISHIGGHGSCNNNHVS